MRKILLVVISVVCVIICARLFPQYFGLSSALKENPNPIQIVQDLPPEGSIQSLFIPEGGDADEILKKHPVKERMNILKMDKSKFSDKGAKILASYPDVTQILISETPTGDNCAFCISQCKKIQRVRMASTQLSDKGMKYFGSMQELKDLDVSSTAVGNQGVENVSAAPRLSKLNLYSTKVDDGAIDSILKMPKLTWLNLDNTGVTDAGVVKLQDMKKLEFLHLGRTVVTDACLPTLKQLTTLKTLHISRTKITQAGFEDLKAALPDCEIVYFTDDAPESHVQKQDQGAEK